MEATVRHIIPQDKKPRTKVFLIAVALISLLIFTKCKNNGSGGGKPAKADTIKTVCLYQEPLKGELRLDYVIRITMDTTKIVDGKVVISRDSLFYTPFVSPMKKDGKDVLDSLGKPRMELVWQPHPKKLIIQDFNANIPLNLNK